MLAAFFDGPRRPLRLAHTDIPTLRPGEVLVRVAACGICHSDLHYIDHDTPTYKAPPLILGHEASGTIERAADGVEGFKAGDRVLLPAAVSCGVCAQCRRGRENICEKMAMFGNHIDGAFAEFVKAPAKDLFHLPAEIPLEDACIIADAVSTPFHAVTVRGQVRPGDTVAVFGCGGVGINAVQIAAVAGARVIAVDLLEEKLAVARTVGAAETIHSPSVDSVPKAIRRLTGGGVDIAFEAIGRPETFSQAFDSVRRGGRLVMVGYSPRPAELNLARTMFFEMEILGSLGCRPVDYPRLIEMVRAGRIKIAPLISHRLPLTAVNEGLDLMRAGKSLRAIVRPAA